MIYNNLYFDNLLYFTIVSKSIQVNFVYEKKIWKLIGIDFIWFILILK